VKILAVALLMGLSVVVLAQTVQTPPQGLRPARTAFPSGDEFISNRPSNTPTSGAGNEYRIGRDDLIDVSVFEIPELSATVRVSASGLVSLPMAGSVEAAGKTPQELERVVESNLKQSYVNDPKVTVFVREYASQPVSVLGAVRVPGIYQMKGERLLLDVLAMAQGIDPTVAGNTIQILRRAGSDADAVTISVNSEELFQNGKTDLNIPIRPNDTINVLQAGSIFVVGEVIRPGEFVLRQGKNITTTQALAQGGGFSKEAKKHECMIVRVHRDGTKEEIPVNLQKVLDGRMDDVEMQPNDILFVPANKVKTGIMRALDTTISTLSARAIYRF
jgi:polysaccharide export outer membrane protein